MKTVKYFVIVAALAATVLLAFYALGTALDAVL